MLLVIGCGIGLAGNQNGQGIPSAKCSSSWAGVEYAAIIRHPVGRWASGFATNLANRIHNGHTTYKKVMDMLEDPKSLEYIFKQVAFEVHTKPQYLFIKPVKDRIELFSAENRGPFYKWLNSRGIEAKDEKLHHVKNFPKDEDHYLIYSRLDCIINNDHKGTEQPILSCRFRFLHYIYHFKITFY